MNTIKVIKYSSSFYDEWNGFVEKSKNATFLFHRDFMEYHQDKFEDYSLLVYRDNKLITLLPANRIGVQLHSHQGLSYGGFIFPEKLAFHLILEVLDSVLSFLKANKFEILVVKQIPKVYNIKPSDELDYLMFILKAKLFRRDISMSIKLNENIKYSSLRKREIKKAKTSKLNFIEEDNFSLFWNNILTQNLKEKFNVSPVHSLTEITLLKEKFPENIKQFSVFDEDEILAGVTVFETKKVAHLQYISTNRSVKKGALDYLINELITKVYKDRDYFDFGISNENQGRNINLGLLNWKQSFGASSVVHDFYKIEVKNHLLLRTVLA